MTTYSTTRKETKEVTVILDEWTTCNFCNSVIRIGLYETWEGQIVQVSGSCYPDSGSTSKYTIDFCQSCWKNTLLPWINSHKALPPVEEFDW